MYLFILPLTSNLLKRLMSGIHFVLLKSYRKIYYNLFQDVPDYLLVSLHTKSKKTKIVKKYKIDRNTLKTHE